MPLMSVKTVPFCFRQKGECGVCVCDSCNCPVSVAKAVFHALLEILDRTFQKINRSSQCLHTHRMKMCTDRSEGAKGCNLEGKDWSTPPTPLAMRNTETASEDEAMSPDLRNNNHGLYTSLRT